MTFTKFSDYINEERLTVAGTKHKDIDYIVADAVMYILENKNVNFSDFWVYKCNYDPEVKRYKIHLTCANEDIKKILEGYNYGRDAWCIYLDENGKMTHTKVSYSGKLYFDLNESGFNTLYGLELDAKGLNGLCDSVNSFIEISKAIDKIGKKFAKYPEWEALFK